MLEKLGTGSYGKVKRWRDINTGLEYAIKIFTRQALRKPRMNAERTTALDDVLREIRIMSKLWHPNVVQLVEVLNDPEHERLYMVLEYSPHGPLMRKNMEDYHFELDQVKRFARDILQGVAYLHAQKVVHRDIVSAFRPRCATFLAAYAFFFFSCLFFLETGEPAAVRGRTGQDQRLWSVGGV